MESGDVLELDGMKNPRLSAKCPVSTDQCAILQGMDRHVVVVVVGVMNVDSVDDALANLDGKTNVRGMDSVTSSCSRGFARRCAFWQGAQLT